MQSMSSTLVFGSNHRMSCGEVEEMGDENEEGEGEGDKG